MDFQRIGLDVVDIIRSGCTWRGWKWRRASDTKEDRDCAIFQIDIDVKPGTIHSLSIIMGFLRFFSSPEKRPDVTHSFFDYLKQRSDQAADGEVRIVVRLEPRPSQPEAEILHPTEE
jgi:hypothetical protein